MTFSTSDIPNNDRLSGTIKVTITEVSSSRDSSVDKILTVQNGLGESLEMYIWATHELQVNWHQGHQYRLSNVRGKTWVKDGKKYSRLSSTRDLKARDLGPAVGDRTAILVVGDTHVGYRNRKPGKQVPRRRGVNCQKSFERIVELAIASDIDAVVHTGDVFDDQPNAQNRNAVKQALNRLNDANIPFYYILGNHESTSGTRLLTGHPGCTHLSGTKSTIDRSTVSLFGIDYHKPNKFPKNAIKRQPASSDGTNILVAHQTFAPFRAGGIDLQGLLNRSPIKFDVVLCGHLHVAEQGKIGDVPVIYTGATDRISKTGTQNNPSTWHLSASGSDTNIKRHSLR